ncbi:substrate-binding domain-containing protein [Paeniroseomonas aquatica]|uniref:substrate-binding domain-containing protein n=1 Tax=Paeniroseomonas aquatica TaxID=373043 RepID=UPI00360C1853
MGSTACRGPAKGAVLVTGSSTVFPFSSAVAERLVETAGDQRVKVASTGTVHGFAQFCRGPSLEHPDVQNASRRMTAGEFAMRAKRRERDHGDADRLRWHRRRPSEGIAVTELYPIPTLVGHRQGGSTERPLGAQSYTSWRQVSADLPDWPIRVIGPPRTSGTRDSFTELAMMAGCRSVPEVAAIGDISQRNRVCATVREDGHWIDAGEDDEAIVRRITTDPDGTLGIFGFSFLDAARDRIEGSAIGGVDDTPATIASGRYPLSRPLFLYVKRPNLDRIPALKDYLTEYVSDRALGSGGYLAQRGLVPLSADRLREVQSVVRERIVMNRQPNG